MADKTRKESQGAETRVREIIDHSAFTFDGKRYEIIQNAKPSGETKTDFYILAYDYANNTETEFKISYKKGAHPKIRKERGYSFVENKVKPDRILYIYGENWSQVLKEQLTQVNTTEENNRCKKLKDEPLIDSFNRLKLINPKTKKITLGWRYEIEALKAPATGNRDLCAIIRQDISPQVFWGKGCSDRMRDVPLTVYDPFTMKRTAHKDKTPIPSSGIPDFILVRHPNYINSVDDVFNNLQDIMEYAKEHWETRVSFLAQNFRWKPETNEWKTDGGHRNLAVWVDWKVDKKGQLHGKPVFDKPLIESRKVLKNLKRCLEKMGISIDQKLFENLRGRVCDDAIKL